MGAHQDVILIGAGPAGLALATSLSNAGLKVTVVERQRVESIANPAPDGRDIALTHRSKDILAALGIWQQVPAEEISPIRGARVEQGGSPHFMRFEPGKSDGNALGYLIPNHLIRKAAYQAALTTSGPEITIRDGIAVIGLICNQTEGKVTLATGEVLTAKLVVAADSRFSESRRAVGIPAHMHDFGRAVIVCRMQHEGDNEGIAHECFHLGRTLAILPLNNKQCSVVLTSKSPDTDELMRMSPEKLAEAVETQFNHRLGHMSLVGDRHRYPLVAVYARNFHATRFALIGDAAVGMHPVTAHGYNFGLYGVETLTKAITKAAKSGKDIGDESVLRPFARTHRNATLPIFLGTNALVKLYTDDRRPALAVRSNLLRFANRVSPLKNWITHQLTENARSVAHR